MSGIASTATSFTAATTMTESSASIATSAKAWRESSVRRVAQVLAALPASTWMLIDITLMTSSVYVAYLVYPPPNVPFISHIALWQAMAIFSFALAVSSLVFGLYERETIHGRSRIMTRMILTSFSAVVVAYALIYIVMYSTVSRRVTALSMCMLLLFGGSIRFVACWARRRISRGVLVVGPKSLFLKLQAAKRTGLLAEYRLLGFAPGRAGLDSQSMVHFEQFPIVSSEDQTSVSDVGLPSALGIMPAARGTNPENAVAATDHVLTTAGLAGLHRSDRPGRDAPKWHDSDSVDDWNWGDMAQSLHRLDEQRVTDIVVGADAAKDPSAMHWMTPCLQGGRRVTNEAIFYESATGQILVDDITPSWFLFADLKVHCDQQAAMKRCGDVLIAIVGLFLSFPLWPVLALLIKLCDGGPVFHTQIRVGQHGRSFRLYKFRTMREDAENGRSVWSEPNDPRVTSVGRWLRRLRLDELPQLFNVLRADMSIVGPRPERPDLVERLALAIPFYRERHLVKPGITGWAQISFRYGSSVEDSCRKLQFDLYYLKQMSFELDLIILFRTLGTFLRGAC